MYIKNILQQNKGKTVEIPVNLAIILSEFLIQSSHIADEDNSQMPYPTFENISSALGYALLETIGHDVSRRSLQTTYDLIAEFESNEKIDDLIKGDLK